MSMRPTNVAHQQDSAHDRCPFARYQYAAKSSARPCLVNCGPLGRGRKATIVWTRTTAHPGVGNLHFFSRIDERALAGPLTMSFPAFFFLFSRAG